MIRGINYKKRNERAIIVSYTENSFWENKFSSSHRLNTIYIVFLILPRAIVPTAETNCFLYFLTTDPIDFDVPSLTWVVAIVQPFILNVFNCIDFISLFMFYWKYFFSWTIPTRLCLQTIIIHLHITLLSSRINTWLYPLLDIVKLCIKTKVIEKISNVCLILYIKWIIIQFKQLVKYCFFFI